MEFKRRRYILNREFQWRFILAFIAISLTASVVSAALFNLFAMNRLEELRWYVHISANTTGEVLRPLLFSFNLFNFIFISVLLILMSRWMMNRIEGPLYRIMTDINRIGEGDLSSPIISRQKDEFQDVTIVLNNMMDSIKEKFIEFSTQYEEVSKGLRNLEIIQAKGMPLKKEAEEIISRKKKIKNEILN